MNDQMRNVLRPKHIKLDPYGMRPATLQEKLERIQEEIVRFGKDFVAKTMTEEILYNELLKREKVLTEEIEREATYKPQGEAQAFRVCPHKGNGEID